MTIEPAGLPAGAAATGVAGAPAWVRKGSAEVQRDYALGVEFEQMLTQQLAGSLTASAGMGEQGEAEEGEGSAGGGFAGAGSGVLSTMVTGALAQGVGGGGGLGLAAELTRDMQSRVGTAPQAPETTDEAPAAAPVAGGTQAETTGGTSA